MKTMYNKQTGEILGTVSGVNSTVETDDEGFINGQYDALEYKIVNDQAVAKTETEKQLYDNARNAETIDSLRDRRNILLASSDWTQAADSPVDKVAWAAYRQALRDLPANTIDPVNPVWPTRP